MSRMSRIIIGVCGFEGSGKDTFANILVDEYGFTKLSFSSILKDVCSCVFGWERSMLEGDTKESRDWREQVDEFWSNELKIPEFSPRLALRTIGTDVMRNHFNQNIWMIALKKKILSLNRVVITDCRFHNEVEFLKDLTSNFYLIHIRRNLNQDYYDYREGRIDKIKDLHESSYSWARLEYDHEIFNTSTIQDLRVVTIQFVGALLNLLI